MTYHCSDNQKCYFPPLLSNGEISFAPDAEGMLGYSFQDYEDAGMRAFEGIVVRAARRSALCSNLSARLFPFGKFTFNEASPLKDWSQSLAPEKGLFESDCLYEDGISIHSKGFIHPTCNLYALQKVFRNTNGTKCFSFDIVLSGYNKEISEYMNVLYTKMQDGVCCIGFKMYGMKVFCGEIRVFIDREFSMEAIENGVRILFHASEGDAVSFYYYLEDNFLGADFSRVLQNCKQKIDGAGFSGLLAECEQHYREFYDLGYVKTSDEKLNSIYQTALYGIKCNTTEYSIAVGFNTGSWDGKYFPFDEYTSYLGLLGANRLQLAKRVPSYRLNNCLDTSIERASDCHRNADTEDMARFHWVSGEIDEFELSSNGHWQDHIFHMPLIGLGAFEYFEYSGDKEFLNDCYRMIRACAKFFTKHMVYQDGDLLYIGKCTDLERLGSSALNPFMTTCGAIKLLQCCSKAARILNIDEEYAKECTYIADKLYESLPVTDHRYIPALHCKQKSIAVFAGKFPFNVLENNDERMLNAWEDFEENGAVYGNMYPSGKGISPWFTTASGIFVAAVNEMLLQTDGNVIRLLPAFPHTLDASFKLAAKGGITVEAIVKNGKPEKVLVLKQGVDVTDQFIIQMVP